MRDVGEASGTCPACPRVLRLVDGAVPFHHQPNPVGPGPYPACPGSGKAPLVEA